MKHLRLLALLLFSINTYGQSISVEEFFDKAHAITGHEHFDRSEYAAAAAAYERVHPIDRDATVLNRLAISYHMLDRLREAENTYKLAIRADDRQSAAFNNLSALYYFQRKYRDAERELRRALERSPENNLLRRNLRATKYARENGRSARDVSDTVVGDHPMLIQQRQHDLLEVVLLMPQQIIETAALHETRGDSFFARRLYEDAIIEYRKSIELDRYNAATINRLGLAYHQTHQLREAESQYRDALRLNPVYLEAINNVGSIEYIRGRYDRALDQYQKALRIRPESPTVLMNMGACLFSMERYDEGFIAYQRALEIDPNAFDRTSGFGTLIQTTQQNGSMLNFYLAKVFASYGDVDRAISYLYRAVEEGFTDIQQIRSEPTFAVLDEDERFERLLESMGSPS